MGLDTSHDCWHGPYSAFSRWRNEVAKAAGYEIAEIKYEGDYITHRQALIDYGHIKPDAYLGEWTELPSDPLIFLIAHADDAGVIHPAQAAPLADRLTELLPKLDAETNMGNRGASYRATTQKFIDGLRAAVAAGEDVDFH